MDYLKNILSSSLKINGDRIAVEDSAGNWKISYIELYNHSILFSDFADQYQGATVVYYGTKSKEYYCTAVGCFANGINFCPVDTQTPLQRLLEIVEQFESYIIITDRTEIFTAITSHGCPVIHVFENKVIAESEIYPLLKPTCINFAAEYFISTSGSTGKPKIVCVPHSHTIDFLRWSVKFYCVNESTRWAQFSNIGFDLSIVDLLTVLCGGGTLVSLSSRIDRSRPAKTVEKAKITHWHSVPSVIPYFLSDCKEKSETCELFTFCGEPLSAIDTERLAYYYPRARIINTYGPTEGTLFCSYYEHMRGVELDASALPIGRSIPGWDFVLVNDKDSFRLIIVSPNAANRYLGTATTKFSTIDVFGTTIPAFDTGDFFEQKNGELYFSHRMDGMIKVNGNRVDLGDIEAMCKRLGLQNPVAVLKNDKIVLYAEGSDTNLDYLRQRLTEILPLYSVPSSIIFLELHPRTSNGKIDRNKLLDTVS